MAGTWGRVELKMVMSATMSDRHAGDWLSADGVRSSTTDIANIVRLKNPENFDLWNFQITIIFKANGLLDIVNGKSLFEDLKDETGKDK
ncbi:hypothetical protein LAZ67_X004346 [Cordylochernes scorpioides]|uniref:Uncharacterized protein n=1 Tax=Cordylochernes scorpioides TaxID=51811 RepID=A0ABY6LUU3_9ARAC|nr:hypothetical protein LAZ67_X004346 [Cordylochernes scorpioides]